MHVHADAGVLLHLFLTHSFFRSPLIRCGPCKVIAPKFEELSETYADSVFLKVIGDSSADASKLMKREGVRSVPSFHFFKKAKKLEVVNGANPEAIEGAINKHA